MRVLQVGGVDLNDKTQEEVVALLRAAPLGGTVTLLASRPEDPLLPREVVSTPVRTSLHNILFINPRTKCPGLTICETRGDYSNSYTNYFYCFFLDISHA